MASTSLPLLSAAAVLLFLSHLSHAATSSSAPAPAPSGPPNITGILEKAGSFSTFLRLLAATQAGNQITSQLNSSTEGMTVFAPTDNAFATLKAGALNSLTSQEQVQLIQYHILPKYYSWDTFETVSNPVNTQASGRTGNWGLNIVSFGVQQVNISTGVVTTQINNALNQKFPLAVYQVEKVLLPDELFGAKAKAPVSSPASSTASSSSKANSTAASPSSSSSSKDESAAGVKSVGLGLVAGLGVVCMGMVL